MKGGWLGRSLLQPQWMGWVGRQGTGCRVGRRNPLQKRRPDVRRFDSWRTEVWSLAAADLSLLLLLSVYSMVRV